VYGLLGILPKQVGLTHDSLLTGDTLLASPEPQSMGVLEPADYIKVLARSAIESFIGHRVEKTTLDRVRSQAPDLVRSQAPDISQVELCSTP
jgi:hypothetical protein